MRRVRTRWARPATHSASASWCGKVRGITGVPGSPGAYGWAGYAGTYFLIDPKEELVVLLLSQSTNPARTGNRRLLTQLVYQAIAD